MGSMSISNQLLRFPAAWMNLPRTALPPGAAPFLGRSPLPAHLLTQFIGPHPHYPFLPPQMNLNLQQLDAIEIHPTSSSTSSSGSHKPVSPRTPAGRSTSTSALP